MKTTLDIADTLLEEVKSVSRSNSVTVRELVEEGLRMVVVKVRTQQMDFKLEDGSVQGLGLQRNMTWDEMLAASYEGHGA